MPGTSAPPPHTSASPMRGKRLLGYMLTALVVAVIPAVALPTWSARASKPEFQELGGLPQLALTDHLGEPLTTEALRNHITIIAFVFTRCTQICPTSAMRLKDLQTKTQHIGDQLKLLTITVDPAYDTPRELAAYAARFGADPARWRFATGAPAAIQALVENTFLTALAVDGITAGGAPNIAHTDRFFLIDKHLQIRNSYQSSDVKRLDVLLHDARYLARTQAPARASTP